MLAPQAWERQVRVQGWGQGREALPALLHQPAQGGKIGRRAANAQLSLFTQLGSNGKGLQNRFGNARGREMIMGYGSKAMWSHLRGRRLRQVWALQRLWQHAHAFLGQQAVWQQEEAGSQQGQGGQGNARLRRMQQRNHVLLILHYF